MGVGETSMVGKEVAGIKFRREVLGSDGDCGEALVEDTDSFFEEFAVGDCVGLS
jgi:hypothetical protein